uniref:DRBM domain-containing protein n=1 Tax=Strigamia maritima TaxID=126957 RepID=T1J8G5_STRMM
MTKFGTGTNEDNNNFKMQGQHELVTTPNLSSLKAEMPNLLPTKTPISLLQELCARRGLTPKYDLLSIEGAVHEPTFVYRVGVSDIVATGTGQSKKKAKHAAAKSVLDKLIGQQNQSLNSSSGQNSVVNEVSQTQIISYDDGIPGNPVGALQELCMARHWPPPFYEVTSEDGLPHERNFAIACSIGKCREVGIGKSKKLAKRQAAYKMLQQLKDTPGKQETFTGAEEEDEEANHEVQRYNSLKDGKIQTLTAGLSQKVSQFHKNLKTSTGKYLTSLQTTSLNSHGVNYVQLLQEIAGEQGFEVTYVDIEELSVSGKNQCLVQLSTLPVAVCYGVGASSKDAQANAAHNALEYLKIMTRK